jgi:multidrug efflux pump
MNLSKFFIDRPIFAGVLSVLIFVGGLLALRVMPISEYPEVCRQRESFRRSIHAPNPRWSGKPWPRRWRGASTGGITC